jgi:type I restriction-modification system DNA methylase subunit
MTSTQQRAALQRQIWQIANDVRGSVDGWDFKQYVLGTLFYKVPVLPLEEQARIVAILDKFDTLTHSISEGLPREIALRQKQYEYYRDLLLSFPKTKEEQ